MAKTLNPHQKNVKSVKRLLVTNSKNSKKTTGVNTYKARKTFHINNIARRGLFIFTIYFVLVLVIIIFNFMYFNAVKKINNFEYWAMFFFAVYLLFAWKKKAKNQSILLVKLLTTFTILIFIIVFISLPVITSASPISTKAYNGAGIIIFSLAWFIEMFLFWTSENEKK